MEFLPTAPFFQQRLERFLFTHYRIPEARVEDLQILATFPPVKAQQKATTVFMCVYKNIPLWYEADKPHDPRSGVFLKIA